MSERLLDPAGLRSALARRTTPAALDWLCDASAAIEADPAAVRTRFAMASRKTGRAPLDPDADAADVHAWTIDDAVRTLLLVALGDELQAELADLYRFGDAGERRGLLRALAYLPLGSRGLGLVDDALRTNDTRLIAAALGPYASAHLDSAAYDQAVLKCVFVGVPIAPLHGLGDRATARTAQMLAAFVHERVAAGRDVPAEVWDVIDRFPPEPELAAIEAELHSEFADRREAAARTLRHHHEGGVR